MQTISPKKYVPDTTGINSTLAAHIIGFARSGVNKEMAHLIEDSAKAPGPCYHTKQTAGRSFS